MYSIIIMAVLLVLGFIGLGLCFVGAPFYMLFTGSQVADEYVTKAPMQIINMCRDMMLTESGYGIVGTIGAFFAMLLLSGIMVKLFDDKGDK